MEGKFDCQRGNQTEISSMPSILFVCLGNICRSPMAEGVAAGIISRRRDASRWRVDSAGTGDWHVGNLADHRTLAVLQQQGLPASHRARQVRVEDFTAFTHIFAMDRKNLAHLEALRPAEATAALTLLGHHDPQGMVEVPDPYYDGPAEFLAVYAQLERTLRVFFAGHPEHE
jgi:protein-tyrosine phosphatase